MRIGGKTTNPGEMRTRIALYSRNITTSEGGFQVPDLVLEAEVWSKWVNVHGSEVWAAQSAQAEQPATVLIRYQEDIDTTWVIEKDGINFEIVSIDDVRERHEYMELKVRRLRSV
jgi:SPP1 family predicted phage head-tail adaptor